MAFKRAKCTFVDDDARCGCCRCKNQCHLSLNSFTIETIKSLLVAPTKNTLLVNVEYTATIRPLAPHSTNLANAEIVVVRSTSRCSCGAATARAATADWTRRSTTKSDTTPSSWPRWDTSTNSWISLIGGIIVNAYLLINIKNQNKTYCACCMYIHYWSLKMSFLEWFWPSCHVFTLHTNFTLWMVASPNALAASVNLAWMIAVIWKKNKKFQK